MNRSEKRRQAMLRAMYEDGWDILKAWATCTCDDGMCPIQRVMARHGVTPEGLLEALVTGRPEVIGVAV